MIKKRQYLTIFEQIRCEVTSKKRSYIAKFITMNDDRTSIFSHPDYNCRPWNRTKSAMQKTICTGRGLKSL